MIKLIRYIISNVINLFTNIILFLISLSILMLNLCKIYNKDLILIQNERVGFGNLFTSIDLARKIFKKKKHNFHSLF